MGNFGEVTGFCRGQDSSGRQRRRWKENKVNLGFISILLFIFGVDFFPFTNSDIYGFVRTINAAIPFNLLSKSSSRKIK